MIKERADGHPVVIVGREFLSRLHYRLRARLPMWVIYAPTTREYPGVWVSRMHVALPDPRPTRFVITHDDLEGLRKELPPDLTRIDRDPSDPEEIVEVWL